MSTDVADLKKLVKELQGATSAEATVNVLTVLKKNVVATESLLRESKAGLAVGKLRTHATKEVSDLAKELVKKWKTEVERAKVASGVSSKANGAGKHHAFQKKESTATPPQTPMTPSTLVASSPTSFKGQLRTAISDGVVIDATNDKTRNKCIELVYDALASDSGAPNDLILKQAEAIERTVLSDHHHQTGKPYKDKMRSLFLNLKDKNNPGLRESIVSGDLDPTKFCRMSSQDMASEERKALDRQIQETNLHKSLGAGEKAAETDAFQCGKCKQRKTIYRQAQTRSADEPMTTFVTCVNCGNRWKFS
ncbi:transcription elongation factor [Rickenella mellea]|uniref:Transcription elongation factor n=1 Tax=Rickenella mellea TaxID=50990 RepID=A0A4Y7PJX2_9AGAM|nr:transcription elongation factor [Rickenella mellea]